MTPVARLLNAHGTERRFPMMKRAKGELVARPPSPLAGGYLSARCARSSQGAPNKEFHVKPGLPELRLSVQYPGGKNGTPTRPQVRRWVRAVCTKPAEVTVRFVGAEEGRQLNRDYRGKDYATNVLSFAYDSSEQVTGDLVLCLPVVEREAREQGKLPEAHFAHMVVHGMLHLQGYDHETSHDDAERMEAIEREILSDLGYPDPYA